jgi:GNAT superfamily N-acetyltransferase
VCQHGHMVDDILSLTQRPAVMSDAQSITVFHTQCWLDSYSGIVPQNYLEGIDLRDREVSWRDRLSSDLRHTALALRGDVIVGLVSWARTDQGDLPGLELMSLYVSASYRGSGVAHALLERALGGAPAHLLVFEENPRARAFYAKHGFSADGYREMESRTGVWELRMVRSQARSGSAQFADLI